MMLYKLILLLVCLLNVQATPVVTAVENNKQKLTSDQLERLLWIDNVYGAARGLIQGLKKGLYLQTSFILKPQCFGEAFELQAYNFISIFIDLEWFKMYEIPGKIYSFITMLDQSCGVEELIFDLWKFCYDKDCSVHAILQNQAKSVFIITGIMNSVAAMYFNEKVIDGSSHDAYFDICENLGQSLGKYLRTTLNFSQS